MGSYVNPKLFTVSLVQLSSRPFFPSALCAVSQHMSKDLSLESNYFFDINCALMEHIACELWVLAWELWKMTQKIQLWKHLWQQKALHRLSSYIWFLPEALGWHITATKPISDCYILVCWHTLSSSWQGVGMRAGMGKEEGGGLRQSLSR